jgi:hypothetical protein
MVAASATAILNDIFVSNTSTAPRFPGLQCDQNPKDAGLPINF